jgi:hypothetical protein
VTLDLPAGNVYAPVRLLDQAINTGHCLSPSWQMKVCTTGLAAGIMTWYLDLESQIGWSV